jgi:predicted AAA+ superfamily ATPase
MIPRIQYDTIKKKIADNKLLMLLGPRAVGKKEIIRHVFEDVKTDFLELDAKDKNTRKRFEGAQTAELKEIFGAHKFVAIHEAQYIEGLQQIIEEILSDTVKVSLILTCSYEPLLDEVLREVLQIQGLELHLMPPSFYELAQYHGLPKEESLLEQRLIYGNYPEVIKNPEQADTILKDLLDAVIFTDLGVTDRINKGEKLTRMLQILAFEVGESISYNEIGERSGLDNETVERYIDLLEKSYVLIKLPSYFNDNRYELKKSHTIYFVDNGVRNALINNFNPMMLRNDWDQLWKNWLISERLKWNKINQIEVDYFFWRTHTKQSMDFIEVRNGSLSAYKTSWEKRKKVKYPASFVQHYPDAGMHTLNRSTYWGFLTKK